MNGLKNICKKKGMKIMKTNSMNSLKLIVSSVTSKLGNVVFDYANQSLIATLFPNSPIFLSYYQSSESITQVAFNLFGGAFSDRYNRRKILIVTDLISALACLIGLFFVKSSLLYFCIIIVKNLFPPTLKAMPGGGTEFFLFST